MEIIMRFKGYFTDIICLIIVGFQKDIILRIFWNDLQGNNCDFFKGIFKDYFLVHFKRISREITVNFPMVVFLRTLRPVIANFDILFFKDHKVYSLKLLRKYFKEPQKL